MEPQMLVIAIALIISTCSFAVSTVVAVALWRNAETRARLEAERAEQFRHMAYMDPVTELASRARFQTEIARRVERANREDVRPEDRTVSLLALDLDGFKLVNDTYGHPTGDEVLFYVARALERAVRPGDTIARFGEQPVNGLAARTGGDEFAVILDGADSSQTAEIALRVQRAISELQIQLTNGEIINVGASVAGISRTGPGLDATTLIKLADLRLYRAKDKGRSGEMPVVVSGRTTAPREGE